MHFAGQEGLCFVRQLIYFSHHLTAVMKIFKLIIIICLFGGFTNKSLAQDTIHWRPNYKLKWEDYKGKPDSASKHMAITSYFLTYNYSLTDTSFHFNVFCYFEKKTSWKKIIVDSLLLQHEQGHFDIGQLYARKLKKAFASYKPVRETIDKDLKNIFDTINNERALMDSQYDKETNFSRNRKNQRLWADKIKSLLCTTTP